MPSNEIVLLFITSILLYKVFSYMKAANSCCYCNSNSSSTFIHVI